MPGIRAKTPGTKPNATLLSKHGFALYGLTVWLTLSGSPHAGGAGVST